jgi:hypothetical protein
MNNYNNYLQMNAK